MRSFLSLMVCLTVSAFLPAAVFAHGSNVFESGHSTNSHSAGTTHEDHKFGSSGDEFEELHEQIEELHQQLAAHDERVRLTDVLGGVGYIAGITGAAYYYFGGRRKKALQQEK